MHSACPACVPRQAAPRRRTRVGDRRSDGVELEAVHGLDAPVDEEGQESHHSPYHDRQQPLPGLWRAGGGSDTRVVGMAKESARGSHSGERLPLQADDCDSRRQRSQGACVTLLAERRAQQQQGKGDG